MSDRPFAVVTGGSNGIGLELARQFLTHGFDVLIAGPPAPFPGENSLDEAAAELRPSGSVSTHAGDLATRAGVEELHGRIRSEGRPLEAIAINAGYGVAGDFARETDLEKELGIIDLNIASVVHLSKLVLPDMVARNRGRILYTASVDSIQPSPFEAVYGASKAFVLMFAEAIRNELNDTEIAITALLPGVTDTNFFNRAGSVGRTPAGDMKAKDDPADVARRGFEALMADKDKVYGGSMKWRIASVLSEATPEKFNAAMHRKLTEPYDHDQIESK